MLNVALPKVKEAALGGGVLISCVEALLHTWMLYQWSFVPRWPLRLEHRGAVS
jgi:hypothetical protein